MRHDFTAEQGIFIVQFAVGHERSAHVPRLVCIRLHNVIKWKQEMRFLWVRSAACIFYPKPAEEKRAQ